MFFTSFKGFFFETVPAMKYWNKIMIICITMISANTLMNTDIISTTVPVYVMLAKIP